MAGVVGFEPTMAESKSADLTTCRYPSTLNTGNIQNEAIFFKRLGLGLSVLTKKDLWVYG